MLPLPAFVAAGLLVDRQLGERFGLEAAVGDRLAGPHREAVGTGGEALLGPLDPVQAPLQVAFLPFGQLVFVEVLVVEVARGGVGGGLASTWSRWAFSSSFARASSMSPSLTGARGQGLRSGSCSAILLED